MSAPATFQEHLHRLGVGVDDPARGLRFCYGREDSSHAGVFLTWPRIAARVRGMAHRLAQAGVGAGEVVLVHSHDQQTAIIAILGAIHLGAIPAAVAPLGAGAPERLVHQFHAIVATARPAAVVFDRPIPDEQLAGRPALPRPLLVESLDERADAPIAALAGPDQPCFLQFTSGSTSVPKGVPVTHRMLLANLRAITAAIHWGPHGRMVAWLPIYHDMSLVGSYGTTVLNQARACYFPTTRFGRSPDLWLSLMAEERADSSAGPNFAFAMVNRLAERRPPKDLDLSCVRVIICGSEPISAPVMRRFAEIIAPLGARDVAMPAFGMAECTLMATARGLGEPLATVSVERRALEQQGRVVLAGGEDAIELVACGRPAQGIALCVLRGDALAAADEVGEILLAGDSVLAGYWHAPEADARAFVERDGRRWLRTGDLGFLHQGELYVCGRAKDVIIHNGVNYYPADIEQALPEALPELVRLAAVVDLREQLADEFIGLGVLFEEGRKAGDAGVAEAAVAEYVRGYTGLPVAVAKALRGGEHIPRTTSGKLVRHEIRATLRATGAGGRGPGAGAAGSDP